MANTHANHDHKVLEKDERRVKFALFLTGGFMLIEVIGGLLANSLTLLADAGHMLSDTAALGLSWYAFRISRRPATPKRSYGYARFQVLAAFINGGSLLAIAILIVVEAVKRFFDPLQVLGTHLAVVAVLGLAVNITAYLILRGGSRKNLNMRGALLHVMGDILGSLAAIGAAITILATGWMPIDPILSIFVALLILRSAWALVSESWHVLMEGAPQDIDPKLLGQEITAKIKGVKEIHHVHLWLLTPDKPLITLHAVIEPDAHPDSILDDIQKILHDTYDIDHATIQLEHKNRED